MNWTEVIIFALGYLLTPALAVAAAALLIHIILKIQTFRAERAVRADSIFTQAP